MNFQVKTILCWLGALNAQSSELQFSESINQQIAFARTYEENIVYGGKLVYSTFSNCKKIDDQGNKIRYRHHCDEGVFTVEIHSCNTFNEPWVVRFDLLDRLGGCINVLQGDDGKAVITTRVGKCGTEYFKKDGWVYLNNWLHIFRSFEDVELDKSSYQLSCQYEEMINFEYDLQGIDSDLGTHLKHGLNIHFWESSLYQKEIIKLDFEIGDPIYISFEWSDASVGLSYSIKGCSMKDKQLNQEFAIVQQGCVSSLIEADRFSNYFEKTKTAQYFQFIGFSFPKSNNYLTLSCRIQMCLQNDKVCEKGPSEEDCSAGYKLPTGRISKKKNSLLKRKNPRRRTRQ